MSDPEFMTVFQAHQRGQSGLVNEFIKQWITKHHNPTWAALVNLLEGLRVYSAARRIKTIIPTAIVTQHQYMQQYLRKVTGKFDSFVVCIVYSMASVTFLVSRYSILII